MFEQVLSSSAKKSLALLGEHRILAGSYLAGGTALALQLGHRYSFDFDFFALEPFDASLIIKEINQHLSNFRLKEKSQSTILGQLGKTKFSLFLYQYPLLYKEHKFLGIEVADVKDIVPMKIAAIADRGTKRE